eukprot:SAG31_NODE_7600_length_1643_cov_16.983808_2_plen_298_part_00
MLSPTAALATTGSTESFHQREKRARALQATNASSTGGFGSIPQSASVTGNFGCDLQPASGQTRNRGSTSASTSRTSVKSEPAAKKQKAESSTEKSRTARGRPPGRTVLSQEERRERRLLSNRLAAKRAYYRRLDRTTSMSHEITRLNNDLASSQSKVAIYERVLQQLGLNPCTIAAQSANNASAVSPGGAVSVDTADTSACMPKASLCTQPGFVMPLTGSGSTGASMSGAASGTTSEGPTAAGGPSKIELGNSKTAILHGANAVQFPAALGVSGVPESSVHAMMPVPVKGESTPWAA